MDKFTAIAVENSITWQKNRLQARFPAFVRFSVADQREFIKRHRDHALELGIDREEDIGTILDCVTMYGEDFFRQPWASDILEQRALHGPDRMALIRHALIQAGFGI